MSAEAIGGGVVLVLLVALFVWAVLRARKGYRAVQSLMARVDAAAEASAAADAHASAQQLVHVAVGDHGGGRYGAGPVYHHERTDRDHDDDAAYLHYLTGLDHHGAPVAYVLDDDDPAAIHERSGGTLGERIRRAESMGGDRDRVRSRRHLGPADRGPVTR